jgi:hypothetical protein
MSLDYGRIFGMKVIFSADLQNKDVYDRLLDDGFVWVRQRHLQFERLVRCPTVGRWLEISRMPQVESVSIESPKGQKLINRLCYF